MIVISDVILARRAVRHAKKEQKGSSKCEAQEVDSKR